MKSLFILMSLFMISFAHASEGPGCGGSYASGLGHVLKGESILFSDTELIPVGSSISDEFYTARVYKEAGKSKVELVNRRTNKKVKLTTKDMGDGLSIASTGNIIRSKDRPDYIPGEISGNAFLVFICID